ncbi:MAG: TfoX/Sxy family protein [Flavobacteriales bacterium]|nr:TfoX/Sxy family protein [Flavobacteriales bacterium]
MAFDEQLGNRLRDMLSPLDSVTEKKMFGGLCFLYKGKMVCGVVKDDLVFRIQSPYYESVLTEVHMRPMDFTGKVMKEFIFAAPQAFADEQSLNRLVEYGLQHARSKLTK